ncbi:MAG TPA: glycerol kinase GlpK [Pantanalinema sp.]
MTARYVLAIDQGTTGSTVLLFDRDGRVAGRAYREVTQHYPQPGWVEHDASEIWRGVQEAIDTCLQAAGATSDAIAGIGITNQRETVVVWDRETGEPVHRAIVWQCRRTAGMCDALRQEGLVDFFASKTGLVLDAYFSGTKLAWLLDRMPGLRERAERGEVLFGTIDSYLLWRLSGGARHATDFSNASRTMLFNLSTLDWDPEILERLVIPRAMLPEVLPNSGEFARTVAHGRLGAGIPVSGMAGDQQAALFGQRCWEEGMGKNTYGTGCFLLVNTGDRPIFSRNRLLTTIAWQIGGKTVYALEGSVFSAGATIQWLRDGLGLISSASQTEALARSVPDTGGVYLVPAFVGLGAPHWDPYARGTIVGITRGTTRAHLVRSALESIAFQSADLIEGMQADTGRAIRELRVDGGASANDFLMQFQADVLGLPVRRAAVVESTAWGAAMLAGLGVGFWQSPEAIPAPAGLMTFESAMAEASRAPLRAAWKRAVSRSRDWVLHEEDGVREPIA